MSDHENVGGAKGVANGGRGRPDPKPDPLVESASLRTDPLVESASLRTDPLTESEPALPEPVRQRVIILAAAALSGMAMDEVPAHLRRIAQFAPNRRARLGSSAIAVALAVDPLFRQRIGARVLEAAGDLGTAVSEGNMPATVDPVEIAALAYLGRPRDWLELIETAARSLQAGAQTASVAERLAAAEQQLARAEHERAVARTEAEKLRDEVNRARTETTALHAQIRQLSRSVREAQARERKAAEMLATEKGRAARAAADAEAEQRRVRAKLVDAELAASGARASANQARAVDDARLWLLLDTLGRAAAGLKRELALEPSTKLPADYVAEAFAERPGAAARAEARALDADDPAQLDQLLALPRSHLVVDGYNVTKRGFGDLVLEHQRSRLTSALGAIAAQSSAEVTLVFDGSDRPVTAPSAPRGVRVLFSRKGESADELIRQLVRAEPAGRPVIVISSDREVAEGVRRHGAYPLSADTLLRRLARS